MQEVEVARSFPAPPQRLWDLYTDHAGWSAWAGFGKSWIETAGATDRNGAGAVRGFSSGGVRVFEEVIDFDPPKRMTYRVVRGGLPMRNHLGEVLFEPEGEGTRLTWRCRFDSKLPGLGPAMRLFVTWVFSRALRGLARHSFPG